MQGRKGGGVGVERNRGMSGYTLVAAAHLTEPRTLAVRREVGQMHIAGGPLSKSRVAKPKESGSQRAERVE